MEIIYFFTLIIVIYILLNIYDKLTLQNGSFWTYQPVVNLGENVICSGVFDESSSFRNTTKWINNTIQTMRIKICEIDKVVEFIQKNFYVEENNIYKPTKQHILTWLTNEGLISLYSGNIKSKVYHYLNILSTSVVNIFAILHGTLISYNYSNGLKGVMTSRVVDIYLDNNLLKVNYIDWLCIEKGCRKYGVAPELIQTHESRLPVGSISLFKLDGKLELKNMPLTIFKTKCYEFEEVKRENNYIITLTKKEYKYHIINWRKTKALVCVPLHSQMMKLIELREMYYILGFYFKNSCMYLHDKLCITLVACVSEYPKIEDLKKAISYLPENTLINIETLGFCNNIIIDKKPIYESSAGLYFYNFFTPTLDNNRVVCIV